MTRMKVDLDKIAEGISSTMKLSKLRKRNRELFNSKEKPNESVQSENSVLSNNEPTTDEKSAKVVDWNDQLRQWQKNTSIIEFKKILETSSDIREGFGHLALALRGLVTCKPEDREKMWSHLMIKQTDRLKFQIVYKDCIGSNDTDLNSASLESIASVLETNGVEQGEIKGKSFETRLFEAISTMMNQLKLNHGKLHAPVSEFATYCMDSMLHDFIYNIPEVNDEGNCEIVIEITITITNLPYCWFTLFLNAT